MSTEQAVSKTYLHGSLLSAIQSALGKMGRSIASVNIADLAPVDEFHIGGRAATERFMAQLKLTENIRVLDVGCGLGGPARLAVETYQCRVEGIDLSQEYINTGNALCQWVQMEQQINLQQGSALLMPFDDSYFERAYMLHVGMNIEDKPQLFRELYRVLKPGAILGVYDVMQQQQGELEFPVPWADCSATSYLASPDDYIKAMTGAGFNLTKQSNRRKFSIEFFDKLRAILQAKGGPPPLGLHTLMQESTTTKINNMVANIKANYIAPVEIIAQKR
jgi:SAM-dependent methyltransferase